MIGGFDEAPAGDTGNSMYTTAIAECISRLYLVWRSAVGLLPVGEVVLWISSVELFARVHLASIVVSG